MATVVTSDFWRVLNPLRLAGPIFDKELRVASRQRRTYALRFVYMAGLSLFLVMQVLVYWQRTAGGPSIAHASQMGGMALSAVTAIVWIQFLAGQLLSIVLLSGAISDEIRKRSLDVLLASPISSVQVVLGKLFGRLVQLILLLAVSLPMLAVIRAFGGVPWGAVMSAACITLTAVIFTGALSLFLSAADRNSPNVTAEAILWCLIAWVGIPMGLSFLHWKGYVGASLVEIVSYLSNPFPMMVRETRMMAAPGARLATLLTSWPMHCIVMLGVSVVILLCAMCKVRRATKGAVAGSGEVREGQRVSSSMEPFSGEGHPKGPRFAHRLERTGQARLFTRLAWGGADDPAGAGHLRRRGLAGPSALQHPR
jgi:ABC-type transport system involved in multi-copper enzyme maturation permease subunit